MTSYAGKIYTGPIREHVIHCGTCTETDAYHAATQREGGNILDAQRKRK